MKNNTYIWINPNDLKILTYIEEFTHAWDYPEEDDCKENEVGKIEFENVIFRFLASPNLPNLD